MPPDPRWSRLQELAEAAESQPASQRAAWLATAEPDPVLRAEALHLVAALEAEAQAHGVAAANAAAAAARPIPAAIGPYRILEPIGSGGRGVVYRAIRDVAGGAQEVALKLFRDPPASPAEVERFEREQRILAGLSHPALARFLDAGFDDQGRPYLVLEWIDGQPLDQAAAAAASRSPRDRVRWMADALDILHAAHQSLVIHLDIKPSNILIDRAGRVRLIDFGTAKLLQSAGTATETHQLTPSYASPEQLRGEPATAAADQYAVALTLLELLTGETRHRSSLAALAERARAETPAVRLPGEPDLAAILQKALSFAPADRYRSAAEFADDLRAWLDGRPVRARRATLFYRFRKFAVRHGRGVAAAAVVLVALGALAFYAVTQQQERLREAERAARVAAFLRGMIDSSATDSSGRSQMTVLEMVERAHQRIENGAPLPSGIGALLQSDFAYFVRESGRDQQAESIARAALRRADQSGDPEARLVARRTLAEITLRLGRCDEAIQLYREADPLLSRISAPLPQASYLWARSASESRCQADPARAAASLRHAITLAQNLRAADSALPPAVFRASLFNALALELARQRRFDEGRDAIAAGLREAQSHPDGRYYRIALQRILGQLEANAGRPAEALAAYERALAAAPGVANQFEETRLHLMAAAQQVALGRRDPALARVEQTLAYIRRQPDTFGAARWMLFADAAEVMARAKSCLAALDLYREADQLTGGQMPRDWRANRLLHTAECTADPARAAALAREALEAYGPQLPPDSPRRQRIDALLAAAAKR